MVAREPADRDDLAQEIAVQLWRAFPSFDERRAAFSTWLYRIALDIAISYQRRERTRARLVEQRLSRARSATGRFAAVLAFELAGNAIAVALLAAFAVANPEARFVVPAAALAAGAIALIVADARQLALARARLSPAEPIAVAQRHVETLRRLRAARLRWTLFAAPLAWPPLAIVGLRALIDVDAWDAPWLAANLAFGLAVLALARCGSRACPTRCPAAASPPRARRSPRSTTSRPANRQSSPSGFLRCRPESIRLSRDSAGTACR